MTQSSLQAARTSAHEVLDRLAIRAPADIQLDRIAKHFAANIEFAPLDGAEAQLLRTAERTTITLADRITDLVAQRFNLAHEIGHLVLAHPTPRNANELTCHPQRHNQASVTEREASACGSELLMPEYLVRPLCDVPQVDLETPHKIARDFTVSILASAIRFTQLTNERCAAVFCVDGKVKWCAKSPRLRKAVPLGMPVDSASVAAEYFSTGTLDDRPHWVPVSAWFKTDSTIEILEHAICSPKHGTTLSMLWIPDVPTHRV